LQLDSPTDIQCDGKTCIIVLQGNPIDADKTLARKACDMCVEERSEIHIFLSTLTTTFVVPVQTIEDSICMQNRPLTEPINDTKLPPASTGATFVQLMFDQKRYKTNKMRLFPVVCICLAIGGGPSPFQFLKKDHKGRSFLDG